MSKLIVEVGMPLDKNIIDYHEMLIAHGLKLNFACVTHDLYYTKQNLDGLTENEMKNACVRLRHLEGMIGVNKDPKADLKKIKAKEDELIAQGYRKVFDTIKFDFQYNNKAMGNNYLQIQDIKDVGLLVYWASGEFSDLPLKQQRAALLNELNGFGFSFKETDLGVDKLRTLYYGKTMYSENQNG